MKNQLDLLLPASKQYHYHRVLYIGSFYNGIIPDDPKIETLNYRAYKYFTIVFMFTLCLRTVVECFIPDKTSPFFLWIGDFKIWWGKPYVAHQVVFLAAVFIVPVYQYINLFTVCPKDNDWTLPFLYAEGLKTGRQIKLETIGQLNQLYQKMKFNFHRSFILMASVDISYFISVFASYYIFYETNLEVFTLGVFWTIYEVRWAGYITQNMGFYPSCLEIITFYCNLRYKNAKLKLDSILKERDIYELSLNNVQCRMRPILKELCDVNMNLLRYNHYWRKITITIFASYVPQILFEVYVCIYFQIEVSVMVFGLTLVANMLILMGQLCGFSATTIGKAYSMRKLLNSIYIRISKNDKKEHRNIRDMLKLSVFVEQYSYKKLGIYLYDYCRLDWNFFQTLVFNSVVYFLLIVCFLR